MARLSLVCQGSSTWQNREKREGDTWKETRWLCAEWARQEDFWPANYPLPFYYDLNWCTTSVELASLGTMLETGTRRHDECNWVFRNRDAFTTTRAHLLPHYRLRGENMLSTAVAKYNDGVTAHWGVEDISPVVETIQWPITVMATFILQREEARIKYLLLSVDVRTAFELAGYFEYTKW